jgi:predicted metalloprotease with PDZ domain
LALRRPSASFKIWRIRSSVRSGRTWVRIGSPADKAGLKAGDVIVAVDRTMLDTSTEAEGYSAEGRTLVDINDTVQGYREAALQDLRDAFGAPHADAHHRIITVRHAHVTAACRVR